MPVIVGDATLHHADCRDVLRGLPDNSIDAVVTDPPYALVSIQKRFGKPGSKPAKDVYARGAAGFMGKSWDTGEVAFSEEFWAEVLRVLKPGGHVVAFSGARTYHRMAVAIEDAGFEIRDQLGWLYGSGFPKSHDVSKGIDKAAGAAREVVGENPNCRPNSAGKQSRSMSGVWTAGDITRPATAAARQWQGWGTALKPAWEPICLARKPLVGTVAENVLKYGTGALNIDGCRVESGDNPAKWESPRGGIWTTDSEAKAVIAISDKGRWPANIVHDGSDEVVAAFPQGRSAGHYPSESTGTGNGVTYMPTKRQGQLYADSGSAARFFYCAKASRKDRDEGLEGFALQEAPKMDGGDFVNPMMGSDSKRTMRANTHPTVKPTDLMRWLCRLVTPPGGVILDPFMGSGSTGKAALLEGFRFIGCEREDEYMPIAEARIRAALRPVVAQQQTAANDNQPQQDLFNAA